jgi:hypothetical protein
MTTPSAKASKEALHVFQITQRISHAKEKLCLFASLLATQYVLSLVLTLDLMQSPLKLFVFHSTYPTKSRMAHSLAN